MLFGSGIVAVALYRFSKPLTWRFAKLQARNLIRLCGVRVRVRGLERLADGPYIFTPNHQSHFDIAALLGYLPGCNRFAAKRETFAEPMLGLVLRTMGMIPVDRDDPLDAIERLNQLKLDGFSVIIFPEGTRSPDGALLPFKKGPFVAAIHLGVPVVPVVCKGTTAIMPKGEVPVDPARRSRGGRARSDPDGGDELRRSRAVARAGTRADRGGAGEGVGSTGAPRRAPTALRVASPDLVGAALWAPAVPSFPHHEELVQLRRRSSVVSAPDGQRMRISSTAVRVAEAEVLDQRRARTGSRSRRAPRASGAGRCCAA